MVSHYQKTRAIVALLLLSPACAAADAAAAPPHIVVLLADDLGWGDLARHGGPGPQRARRASPLLRDGR